MRAVEWQFNELQKIEKALANKVIDGMEFIKMKYEILEKAKEMEKEQKIEFACAVYDKYNFGPQEISFREECEQFKSE